MLIDLTDMIYKYQMRITGILHVGAHLGEEALAYRQNRIQNVVWVEGNPALIGPLRNAVERYGHRVVSSLVTDKDGEEIVFHITNNGQSSSVLEFGTHPQVSPDVQFIGDVILRSKTIDTLAREYNIRGCNFMNIDLQGAELLALRGAERFLNGVDYIYTEINTNYLYKNCVLLWDLDDWLKERNFIRVETHMTPAEWGDGLYVKRDKLAYRAV